MKTLRYVSRSDAGRDRGLSTNEAPAEEWATHAWRERGKQVAAPRSGRGVKQAGGHVTGGPLPNPPAKGIPEDEVNVAAGQLWRKLSPTRRTARASASWDHRRRIAIGRRQHLAERAAAITNSRQPHSQGGS